MSEPSLQLQMYPAFEGDCLMVVYDDGTGPRRVLIDGGHTGTYRRVAPVLADLPDDEREFELLIVTHVDADHIEGALSWLQPEAPVTFKDIWFNSYRHLSGGVERPGVEEFGPAQGEKLTGLLRQYHWDRWNAAFGGGPVEVGVPAVTLDGGLELQILGPTRDLLEALVGEWETACIEADLIPGAGAVAAVEDDGTEHFGPIDIDELAASPFVDDDKHPNGSSIVVLATFLERRLLLTGDSHAGPLVDALELLAPAGERVALDVFKIGHHGSDHNTSTELLDRVDCSCYLISTNGSRFDHPKPAAIARIITNGGESPEIDFNYRSEETSLWDNDSWRAKHGYRTRYPADDANGFQRIDVPI